ncbi:pyridoxal phosphate-dependent aminotransferase [Clavibacter zhangzhiyongii]|uniref:pyridoxal phosphate-dependent aminotransferase n=1 Tax=Clavibacter zhangzhiyongii TaxID=2768071 RepID=UPI0039E0EFEC
MTPEPAPLDADAGAPVRLRPAIAAMVAYRQGKPAGEDDFKLSSNENPFDPLPSVLARIDQVRDVNRYPDAGATLLRTALAERFGVTVDHVHAGAGSVAILSQLITAAAGPGDEVVHAWRSFEAYPTLITVAGATGVPIPNLPDHSHDVDGMIAALTDRTRVVIVCTPNNPTGTLVTEEDLERLLAAVPRDVLVLLDEAYGEFVAPEHALDGMRLLDRHPNLVVLRTFSKAYGLAGLRIGYAVGHPRILDAARSAAIPLSVTGHAQHAALASLEHEDELLERVAVLARDRDEAWRALTEQGWEVPRPHGNFVWLATGAETAEVEAQLAAAGLVVRAFGSEGIRVTVGEPASVRKLLNASAEIVRGLPEGHPARR